MKKLLISLTILFSVFIGVNSVNAKTETATYKFTSDKNAIINTYNMTNEEIKNYTSTYKVASDSITNRIADNFIKLREYYENNYKSKYDYYIIINYLNYSGGYFQLFAFNEDSINQKLGNMINSSSYYKILAVNFFNLSANKFESVYLDNNNKFKTSSSTYNTYVYSGGDTNSFNINYQSTYYETNYNMDISLSSTGHNSIVYDSFTYDSKIYYPNDFLFNTMTSNELNRLKDTKPKLTYKTGFVSSEAYSVLGKVSVDFSETDKNIYKYKISQFKLQFGSNDFSRENIPIYSHYKVFGKRNDTWTELSEEDLKIPYAQDSNGNTLYDDRRLITIDTTYDYSEGMLADASITLQINYSNLVDINTTDPIYTDWKIEFYFDNTNNGYIYVYDTLDSSKWTDTAKIFSDYIFYYFPPQYRYAFISSEENTSTGRIYFPSNSYMNEAVRLKGFYYHYNINWVGDELKRIISEDDQYYSYFDYKFSYDDKQCVVLSRKMAAAYQGYYDPDFLNNYMKLFPDEQIIINTEISYFYAPIGVKVTFAKNTSDTIIIHTPEGVIKNDSNTIYDSTDYDINFTYNNVDDLFSHLTNFFSESIPYMKPLVEIFNNFYKSLNEYIRAFIEFFCIFILVAAVVLWLNKRSEK